MSQIDWTKSMQQTFEFYKVDPLTWKDLEPLDKIEKQTINRDRDSSTLSDLRQLTVQMLWTNAISEHIW